MMAGEVTCESNIKEVMGGRVECGNVGNVDQAAAQTLTLEPEELS